MRQSKYSGEFRPDIPTDDDIKRTFNPVHEGGS